MNALIQNVKNALDAKRAEAATAWKEFSDLRDSAVKEGVDFSKDPDAFAKLDESGKQYDVIRDEISELEVRFERLVAMHGFDGAGASSGKLDPAAVDRKDSPRRMSGSEILEKLAERYMASDAYKAIKENPALLAQNVPLGNTPPVKVLDRNEFKTLVTAGDSSGGAFIIDDRMPGFVAVERRPVVVADLVNVTTTDSDLVEYVKQDSRTNNAAETAEATATGDASGAAPESAAAYSLATTTVRDITHFIPATKKLLADAGQMEGVLRTELADGVRERLDAQMVAGNGTAPNLRGIRNASGILTQALGTDSRSDAIHKAITQVRKEFFEPDALLIHPDDWEQIVLEKDANGNYIYGPPSAPQRRTIWGLTPVVNPVIGAGNAVVANFRRAATLWIREGVTLAASDSHDDFFIRRMVALLATFRVAFEVQRPKAVCDVTGI